MIHIYNTVYIRTRQDNTLNLRKLWYTFSIYICDANLFAGSERILRFLFHIFERAFADAVVSTIAHLKYQNWLSLGNYTG